MAKFGKILLTLLSLVAMSTSCIKDQTQCEDDNSDKLTITIGTRGANASADPLLRQNGEARISTVRVYAFDGARLDQVYYEDNIITGTLGSYTVTLSNISRYAKKKICAIVNEPSNQKDFLDNLISPQQLQDLDFLRDFYVRDCYRVGSSGTYKFTDDILLPMYGSVENVNTLHGGNISTTIYVDRAVARVDLVIKRVIDATLTTSGGSISFKNPCSIDLKNDVDHGYFLFSNVMEETRPYTTVFFGVNDGFDLGNNGTTTFVFYVPERLCTKDEDRFGVRINDLKYLKSGTTANFEFLLKEVSNGTDTKVLNKIERNKVYTMNVTFNDHYPIQFSASVAAWEEVSTDVIM